jgi:NAD(P)-dependent dehydrogenase (short-subunit alcohol dehydrogenase family)
MKTAVITGANVGIGFATAKFLAATPGWHVVLACRNELKATAAVRDIRQSHPEAHISFAPLDLFSLASVRRLPATLVAMQIPGIDALILNAGGINMAAKALEFTEDGFERIFQLNFLGHFLLVNLLIEQMTTASRIIFVSSDLHDPAATKMGKIMAPTYGPVNDLASGIGTAVKLKPMARYATAKMYAMMAAYELDRRLQKIGKAITVNSWSPGVVPTTQAARNMSPVIKKVITSRWFVSFMGSHLSSVEEAAQALGSLVTDASYSGIRGRYFDGFREIPSSLESRNEAKARTVWEQSARLADLATQNEEQQSAEWRPPSPYLEDRGLPLGAG